MKIAFAMLLFASPAVAFDKPDTDYPHRDWGQVAILDMTLPEASACVARQLARQFGRVTPVPADGGMDIEGGPGGGIFGVAHDPWISYQVRSEARGTVLRVFYRHPISQGNISRDVRRMERKCLKISSIAPA